MSSNTLQQSHSCTCSKCQSACRNKPGWFLPGEAALAAALKGMTLPAFFSKYLAVDWWEADGGGIDHDVFVLAPALKGETPGTEYPGNPKGECVFLTDEGKCDIHAAKPSECKWYDHGKSGEEVGINHESTAKAWDNEEARAEVVGLLGREPESESYGLGGLFGGMFS